MDAQIRPSHCTSTWCTLSVSYVRCSALSLLSGLCSHMRPTAAFQQTAVVAWGHHRNAMVQTQTDNSVLFCAKAGNIC